MCKKKLFTALFLCVLFPALFAQTINLSSPDLEEKVQIRIYGNGNSSHYHRPLLLDLKNISPETQFIEINPGQLLVADDESLQNFVIVEAQNIRLDPEEAFQCKPRAMCVERSDAAPGDESSYRLGAMADSGLTALTEKISSEKLFGYEAQTAVWAMVGDYQLIDVVGFDTCLTRQLVNFVAAVKGLDLPPQAAYDDYSRSYYAPVQTFSYVIRSSFSYGLFKKSEVIIAMFDKDNIVVRELYKNENCPAGAYEMDFNFDAREYRDDFYYVRLLEDGIVVMELFYETPEKIRNG